jgi:hypothetical protein
VWNKLPGFRKPPGFFHQHGPLRQPVTMSCVLTYPFALRMSNLHILWPTDGLCGCNILVLLPGNTFLTALGSSHFLRYCPKSARTACIAIHLVI